jgi:hypothetical protein
MPLLGTSLRGRANMPGDALLEAEDFLTIRLLFSSNAEMMQLFMLFTQNEPFIFLPI